VPSVNGKLPHTPVKVIIDFWRHSAHELLVKARFNFILIDNGIDPEAFE
jgi:hypothetical protein